MMEYNRNCQVDIRIVRIFTTYGPNLNKEDGRVVSNFINQALESKDITIYRWNSNPEFLPLMI